MQCSLPEQCRKGLTQIHMRPSSFFHSVSSLALREDEMPRTLISAALL